MQKQSKERKSFLNRTTVREFDTYELDRQWRAVFNKYDSDGDGVIPLVEIKSLLQAGNESTDLNTDFPKDVLNEILDRADWNKDNMLDYEEFLHMVHAANLGSDRPRFQRMIRFVALAFVPQKERAATVRRYMEHYSCCPPPIFMLLVSLVEFAVFIYYCIDMKEIGANGPIPTKSPLIYNPHRRQEAWRFLTYMLIHAGIIHITFNVLIQLMLGVPLEMVHKWWRIGLVYLAGGIAGSLGSSLSDPYTYLAGASGGVYALIAAHLANVIINYKEMEFALARLLALFLFAGTDIGVALYYRYAGTQEQRVSYAAHFAGALGGLLVGITLLRNLRVYRWEIILGRVTLAIYILLMLFGIFWNAFHTSYFPEPQ